MDKNGYVYILKNESMPGLLKIGITTRSPEQRIGELSSATGVPTPFQMAYCVFVSNHKQVEKLVHEQLSSFRKEGKEFFEVNINEAIDLVSEIAEDNKPFYSIECSDAKEDFLANSNLSWEEYESLGAKFHFGFDDVLQDNEDALNCYLKAYEAGSPTVCSLLASMYELGEGCKPNQKKALFYYKEGVKRGDYKCNIDLANYYKLEENYDNADKCWIRYFSSAIDKIKQLSDLDKKQSDLKINELDNKDSELEKHFDSQQLSEEISIAKTNFDFVRASKLMNILTEKNKFSNTETVDNLNLALCDCVGYFATHDRDKYKLKFLREIKDYVNEDLEKYLKNIAKHPDYHKTTLKESIYGILMIIGKSEIAEHLEVEYKKEDAKREAELESEINAHNKEREKKIMTKMVWVGLLIAFFTIIILFICT
ncbi:MAG: GIY-YIG nuclease family protein [Candidatus Electryonea clarkiae]|nr:GIY-YIG nuclease family protein [Candidatus Electryonea clarkiae]MDP8288554.1 GIY-YIG nuclease family protein [Candidatus Electryonea clarkiae]